MISNIEIEEKAALPFPVLLSESQNMPRPIQGDMVVPYESLHGTGPNEQSITHEHEDKMSAEVRLIPIDIIYVVNPRERNKKKFQQIVASISRVGLKKPITVRERSDGKFDLVCGQGRLEAFKQLGETIVPAIIREVCTEDALLMSLIENIARKRPSTMDTVRQLASLRDRGYTQADIGRKTGMSRQNIGRMLCLYDRGEEQLLNAVESGRVSLSSAMIISRDDGNVQAALTKALEEKQISASELRRARCVADIRKAFGKDSRKGKRNPSNLTPESVVRTFRREQERQRQALKKAELCEAKLLFSINALKMLFRDDNFVNVLRAEGLETVPEYVAEQLKKGENHG